MRTFVLAAALAVTSALGAISHPSPAHAQARLIPWCARNPTNPYGDCMYYTYEQCRAAISGLPGECIRNPYTYYNYAPAPRVHHRRHDAY